MGKAWLRRTPLVNTGPQAVQRNFHSVEALGVTDEQVAIGRQKMAEPVHQLLLGGAVEIDQHIAAENDLERLRMTVRFYEVDLLEGNPLRHGRFDPATAL